MFLDLAHDVIDAGLAREQGEVGVVVHRGAVHREVGDAEVVEGREQIGSQGVLQGDLVGDVVVEEGEDVLAGGARGRRRHAE